MTRIDRSYLESLGGLSLDTVSGDQAEAIVERFGWLSPWWLAPEVRQRAAEFQPAYADYVPCPGLPLQPGGCWLISVTALGRPILSPANLLPLRWVQGPHDTCLPLPLRTLADQVTTQLELSGWGLRLACPEGENPVDLSALDASSFGVASGWASLVGGLQLARNGGTPDPRVWASVAWSEEFGAGQVDGLEAKFDLAQERDVRRMFVSVLNRIEKHRGEASHPQMQIETIELSKPGKPASPTGILSPYLAALETEPSLDESLERRSAFYARTDRRRADAYYWTHLLGDAIERCRANLQEPLRQDAPTHVVSVVSNLATVVALAPAVVQARRCLLLYEPSQKPNDVIRINLEKVTAFLQGRGTEVVPVPLTLGDRAGEMAQMAAALKDFLQGTPPPAVAADLTPGFKNLSLQLDEIVPVGTWLLYCRHRQLPPDNRVDPGTERYDSWKKH